MDTTMKITNSEDERVKEIAKRQFDKKALLAQLDICTECLFYSKCEKRGNDGNHCKDFRLNSFEENVVKILNEINTNLKEIIKTISDKTL